MFARIYVPAEGTSTAGSQRSYALRCYRGIGGTEDNKQHSEKRGNAMGKTYAYAIDAYRSAGKTLKEKEALNYVF